MRVRLLSALALDDNAEVVKIRESGGMGRSKMAPLC